MCSVVAVLRSSDFAILLLRDGTARRDAAVVATATAAAAAASLFSSLHSSPLISSPLTDLNDSAFSLRTSLLRKSPTNAPGHSSHTVSSHLLASLSLLLFLLLLSTTPFFSAPQVLFDSHLRDRDNGPVAGDR